MSERPLLYFKSPLDKELFDSLVEATQAGVGRRLSQEEIQGLYEGRLNMGQIVSTQTAKGLLKGKRRLTEFEKRELRDGADPFELVNTTPRRGGKHTGRATRRHKR